MFCDTAASITRGFAASRSAVGRRSASPKSDIVGPRRSTQFPIQGSQGQTAPPREFQIRRIMQGVHIGRVPVEVNGDHAIHEVRLMDTTDDCHGGAVISSAWFSTD